MANEYINFKIVSVCNKEPRTSHQLKLQVIDKFAKLCTTMGLNLKSWDHGVRSLICCSVSKSVPILDIGPK